MEMQLDGFSLVKEIPETPRTLIITMSSHNLLFIYKSKVSCRSKMENKKGCYSDLKINLETLIITNDCSFKAHQNTYTAP